MKTISRVLMGLLVGVALLGQVEPARAATLNPSQVQAIISLLQSFGADQATITRVGLSLGSTQPTWGGLPDLPQCPNLSQNLYLGLTDSVTYGEVSALQQYLGIVPSGYFGPVTRAKVSAFQAQNNLQVTGGVGPLTRALIVQRCTKYSVPTPSGATFALNTTFRLDLGQTGTEYSLGQLSVQFVATNGTTAQVTLGLACARGTQCLYYPTQTVPLALNQTTMFQNYAVTLVGLSTSYALLKVTYGSAEPTNAGITMLRPFAGQTFARGQDLTIVWAVSSQMPSSNSSVLLDLYTEAGGKIGTIAIVESASGSYTWRIPGFPQNYMCTMQYPNGLCGANIPSGRYYIQATTAPDGFNLMSGVAYPTAKSGTFTIEQATLVY